MVHDDKFTVRLRHELDVQLTRKAGQLGISKSATARRALELGLTLEPVLPPELERLARRLAADRDLDLSLFLSLLVEAAEAEPRP